MIIQNNQTHQEIECKIQKQPGKKELQAYKPLPTATPIFRQFVNREATIKGVKGYCWLSSSHTNPLQLHINIIVHSKESKLLESAGNTIQQGRKKRHQLHML